MGSQKIIVVWFRQDLRLLDHPALSRAIVEADVVVPLYIFDERMPNERRLGGASRWWLHHSLSALSNAIEQLGARLVLRRGRVDEILPKVAKACGADEVFVTRLYDPDSVNCEHVVQQGLESVGIKLRRFSGFLLREPEQIKTLSDGAYKVYTPFWRTLAKEGIQQKTYSKPSKIPFPNKKIKSDALNTWGLLPEKPDWAAQFASVWRPGEAAAVKRLKEFVTDSVDKYREQREVPGVEGTSRLSPHLHFGEISPVRIWHTVAATEVLGGKQAGRETFLKEIVWREFSAHLMFHFPHIVSKPFKPAFAKFPWRRTPRRLKAWQAGQTGYPIVDAGMRELWATGWMHNRVRMIVASFLIKHLNIPWQDGEAWFHDTLVDADVASNCVNWQWVAGCGPDAAPFFRIFNPIKQGQKFDAEGTYVRRWVPELAELPNKHLHAPWLAPKDVLVHAGLQLGKNYPKPIVDHDSARQRALSDYKLLREETVSK